MTSGLAISAFMPSITSGAIFSSRRTNSGVDAMAAHNPFVGAMNLDIAAGQVTNAAKGVANIAKESKAAWANGIISAEESIKALSKGDKVLRGISKVVDFTANNINPLICATGAVKVLTADDKSEAFGKEALALGTMFGAEALAKQFIGMPYNKSYDAQTMTVEKDGLYQTIKGKKQLVAKEGAYKINNGKVLISRDGWYRNNPFMEKQAVAIKDFSETTKLFNKYSLKGLPGILKGLAFVTASISGYKLGAELGETLIGKKTI